MYGLKKEKRATTPVPPLTRIIFSTIIVEVMDRPHRAQSCGSNGHMD